MDYTEIYRCIKKMLYTQGIDESFLERHETLYYDESGNIKHLIVKGQQIYDNPMLFKSLLYEVLKADPIRTINHFKQYKYLNIN